MYNSTILVTSTFQNIFPEEISGAYSLEISEQAEQYYFGCVSIQEHGATGSIQVENIDMRGFVRFDRFFPAEFTFDNVRTYTIQKIGDFIQIKQDSTDILVNFIGFIGDINALEGQVTGPQNATVVSYVGDQSQENVVSAVVLANNATNLNTASTIVKRDINGDFDAGTITATLIGSSSLNVLKTGDTMTGQLIIPAGSVSTPSIKFSTGINTGFYSQQANFVNIATNGTSRVVVTSSGQLLVQQLTTPGVVHNTNLGALTSSLIVNADVDAAAGIVDTKLATISTAGKVSNSATTGTSSNIPFTLVLRDESGVIEANLTGNASTATESIFFYWGFKW